MRSHGARSVEEIAQAHMEVLHTFFDESVVLARSFLTICYCDLPQSNQNFVRNLAEQNGLTGALRGDTPVLSLIGTHGLLDE